jgi:metal-responsive CopG/Arc/MetJ family transcriptional regulator
MLSERFEMRYPAELLQRVDEWRRIQPGLPSRAEAIRRLIEAGLQAQEMIPIRGPKPAGG